MDYQIYTLSLMQEVKDSNKSSNKGSDKDSIYLPSTLIPVLCLLIESKAHPKNLK